MLKRKHRIIPIVLEGLSQMNFSMDKNLKGIIDSVTYIEWPGQGDDISKKKDKFWKQLQLSLPKKKVLECSGSCISDSLTGMSNSTVTSSIKSDSLTHSPSFIKKNLDYVSQCPETPVKMTMSHFDTQETHEKEGFEDDEEVYDEIGEIDETLTCPVTPARVLPKRVIDEPPSYDYAVAPMREDSEPEGRYIEFRSNGDNEHIMDIVDPGYIEFEI